MKYSRRDRISKKIAKLAEGKNVSWVFENEKILLQFKINLTGINYDYAMMAAFDFKKRIAYAGKSEYMIIFECIEKDLETAFCDAEIACKAIIKEAKKMSDYENAHELKNDMRLHALVEMKK